MKLRSLALALAMAFGPAFGPVLPSVAAQDVAETQERARRLFEKGLALSRSDRWAEALSEFRRSAKLAPRASTSYNIANALYRLDRPVEGLAELDSYDKMPEVLNSEVARVRGETLRELLEGAIGEVRLAITPADAQVFIDGRLSTATGPDRLLRLNAGAHSIRATQKGYETSLRQIDVERGIRQTYAVALRPLPKTGPASVADIPPNIALEPDEINLSTPKADADDRKPFVKRPGFWVMIGVLAAAGIGAGVAVALVRKNDEPQCGTTGSCARAQGLTVTSF